MQSADSAKAPPATSPDELADMLRRSCTEVADYFGALSAEELATHRAGAWAPLDDFDHLRLSLEPVARAFGTDADALAGRFGAADRPSMTYAELETSYLERLAQGVTAPPPFVPDAREGVAADDARNELLSRWSDLVDGLATAVRAWSEQDLDRCQLPHPALGALTLREMLFFVHLHNRHHIEVAQGRLAGSA